MLPGLYFSKKSVHSVTITVQWHMMYKWGLKDLLEKVKSVLYYLKGKAMLQNAAPVANGMADPLHCFLVIILPQYEERD